MILKNGLRNYFDVDICYIESLDSIDAIFWSERMVAFRMPDIVIYHLGINDCAPRLFKKNSKSILLNDHFRYITKDLFLRIFSRYRSVITKWIKKTYVTEGEYRKNFFKMISRVKMFNKNCIFFGIGIAYGNKSYLQKSPDLNNNVKQYNLILKEIFGENFIDINLLMDEDKLHISDGIHLTREGHYELA